MDCGVARLIPSAGEKAGSFCKAPSFVLVFQRSELAIAINTPLGCSEEIIPALVLDTLVDRGNFSVFFSFIGEGSCDFPQRAILLPVNHIESAALKGSHDNPAVLTVHCNIYWVSPPRSPRYSDASECDRAGFDSY